MGKTRQCSSKMMNEFMERFPGQSERVQNKGRESNTGHAGQETTSYYITFKLNILFLN